MTYAYIRVSTETQNYEGQHFEIESYCLKNSIVIDRWVKENVSGTKAVEKRTLGHLLRRMKRGDLLLCTELSRLGRNMMMVMSILNTCSAKGIHIHSIKDHFDLSDDLNAKIIAFAFSLAAEIERNLISQRTKEALAAKKKAGVRLGRPPGSSSKLVQYLNKKNEVECLLTSGVSKRSIATQLGIHYNTLCRYLKEYQNKKQEKQCFKL